MPSEVRLIQVSDLHLGSTYFPAEAVWAQVLTQIRTVSPAAVIATGDLTDNGQPAAWQTAVATLGTLNCPWHWVPGNHDRLRKAPRAVALGAWRLFLLDSTHPHSQRGEGAIGPASLRWLQRELARMTEPWALLAWHHHPLTFAGELAWLNEIALSDAAAVLSTLTAFPQVRGLMFGHVHRAVTGSWGPLPVWGCPATCYQVTVPDDPPAAHQPGFREWFLHADGTLHTLVHRVNPYPEP